VANKTLFNLYMHAMIVSCSRSLLLLACHVLDVRATLFQLAWRLKFFLSVKSWHDIPAFS